MTTLCALVLTDREELELDVPIARYWPEFAQAGKGRIPVRNIFDHSVGLPGWDEVFAFERLYDWDYVTGLLAAQAPWWALLLENLLYRLMRQKTQPVHLAASASSEPTRAMERALPWPLAEGISVPRQPRLDHWSGAVGLALARAAYGASIRSTSSRAPA